MKVGFVECYGSDICVVKFEPENEEDQKTLRRMHDCNVDFTSIRTKDEFKELSIKTKSRS